jgi:hypothetical protein
LLVRALLVHALLAIELARLLVRFAELLALIGLALIELALIGLALIVLALIGLALFVTRFLNASRFDRRLVLVRRRLVLAFLAGRLAIGLAFLGRAIIVLARVLLVLPRLVHPCLPQRTDAGKGKADGGRHHQSIQGADAHCLSPMGCVAHARHLDAPCSGERVPVSG